MSVEDSKPDDTDPYNAISAALRRVHTAAGRPSARHVARQIGTVSHTTVAEALSGRRIPSWPVIASIVRHLGGSDAESEFRKLWAAATNKSPAPSEYEQDDDAFLAHYRELVASYHAVLRGAETIGQTRTDIDDIFIEPRLAEESIASSGTSCALTSFKEFSRNIGRTILLGGPGSGKTTLCHTLIRNYARHRDLPTPFLIPIREFAADFPLTKSVIGFIETRIEAIFQSRPPTDMVKRHIATQPTLVIFDGLDEVLRPLHRTEIVSIIELFAKENPHARVLATSRPIGHSRSEFDPDVYTTYRILDFDDVQVTQCARKIFTQGPSSDVATDKLVETFLSTTAGFSELRKNPLLLTYLCTLYRHTKSVPRTRAKIYEQLVTLMFEEWDASRGVVSWSSQAARPLVAPAVRNLALKMLENNKHEVTGSEFLRVTQQFIEERYSGIEAEQAARDIVDFLRSRPWLLANCGVRADGQETYQFAHKTVMEYFAAAQLVRNAGQPEHLAQVLSSRVSAQEWGATGKLAIQLMDDTIEHGAARVIGWLLDHSDTLQKTERHQLLRFVGDSSQITNLPKRIDSRIREATKFDINEEPNDRIASREAHADVPSHPDDSNWPISSTVPPSIADALTTIQGLVQRSRSNPDLASVAVTWICATYEATVRGCLPAHYGHITNPVEAVQAQKLTTENEAQLLNEAFRVRNSITHGRQSPKTRYDAALRSVRIVHDAISILFDRVGGTGSATS